MLMAATNKLCRVEQPAPADLRIVEHDERHIGEQTGHVGSAVRQVAQVGKIATDRVLQLIDRTHGTNHLIVNLTRDLNQSSLTQLAGQSADERLAVGVAQVPHNADTDHHLQYGQQYESEAETRGGMGCM